MEKNINTFVPEDDLPAIRCASCSKIIAKGRIQSGKLEIRCKCGCMNKIEIRPEPSRTGTFKK